jgi:hypothetical protein
MHRWLSRAVSRNRSIGRPRVFVIRLDGLDDEIELIGAVDLPIHAVILAWREGVGFCEVVQAIDSARRVISHEEHNTGTVFRPREQEQVIGAEVEHREGKRSQLPAYEKSESTEESVLVILRVTESDSSVRDVLRIREEAVKAGKKVPDVYVIDARPTPSASKR